MSPVHVLDNVMWYLTPCLVVYSHDQWSSMRPVANVSLLLHLLLLLMCHCCCFCCCCCCCCCYCCYYRLQRRLLTATPTTAGLAEGRRLIKEAVGAATSGAGPFSAAQTFNKYGGVDIIQQVQRMPVMPHAHRCTGSLKVSSPNSLPLILSRTHFLSRIMYTHCTEAECHAVVTS